MESSIQNNFYVDDLLKFTDNVDNAINLINEIKTTVSEGEFNLNKFKSNSNKVLEALSPICKPTKLLHSLDVTTNVPSKALSLNWNTQNDTFSFKFNKNDFEMEKFTKRNLLKILAYIYDTFGIASPTIIEAEKCFQEACRTRLHWEDVLPDGVRKSWEKWLENISTLVSYEIPRCIERSLLVLSTELHTFCDGSEHAYGAVTYVKNLYDDHSSSTALIDTKSRLTPLNNSTLKTIHRIELRAAKLAVKLSEKISVELDYEIAKVVFWSDSTTVLNYLKSDTIRFHSFVSNKVSFIRNFSNPIQWNYVPTKHNPANIVSRGSTPIALSKFKLWNHGPEFLMKSNCFPPQDYKLKIDLNGAEIKMDVVQLTATVEESTALDAPMNSTSKWFKLKQRVAWMLLIKEVLCKKVRNKMDISVNELENIRNNVNLPKNCSLGKLSPFLDNTGVLRVGGRIHNSVTFYDRKHPVIIPPSALVQTLLQDTHESVVWHLGREAMRY